MKRWQALSVPPLLAALALPVQADTLLGVKIGGQLWNMDGDGTVGNADNSTQGDFDFDDETQNSFYIAIEHPVPLLPNVKLKRTDLEATGQGSGGFTFEGQTYTSSVATDVDFSHNDLILYYELLDNWISLDLGINVMQLDGHVQISESDGSNRERVEFDGYLPTLYAAAEAELPLTGLSVGGEFSGLAAGGHHFYDAQAHVQYKVIDNLAVDVALQVGYRETSLELDDIDDIDTDLEFSGAFAGVQVHF